MLLIKRKQDMQWNSCVKGDKECQEKNKVPISNKVIKEVLAEKVSFKQ